MLIFFLKWTFLTCVCNSVQFGEKTLETTACDTTTQLHAWKVGFRRQKWSKKPQQLQTKLNKTITLSSIISQLQKSLIFCHVVKTIKNPTQTIANLILSNYRCGQTRIHSEVSSCSDSWSISQNGSEIWTLVVQLMTQHIKMGV